MTRPLRWSAISLADVHAWAALTDHLAEVDQTDEIYAPEDLREELEAHDVQPERDTLAVWDGDAMIAFGQVFVSESLDERGRSRCTVLGGVHADWRSQGIGRALMDRLEARAVEASAERNPGAPSFFRASGGRTGSSAQRMLERRGYEIVRYFNALVRPIEPGETVGGVLRGAAEPHGVVLRAPTEDDEAAVRAAHDLAFVDHWGNIAPSAETWHERWTARSARPVVSTVAVSPEGDVLAYALCSEWVERELYVELVGTVPAARGRGLGSAVLAHSIAAAAASGDYDKVELDVDSESLTGAVRLYERLSFVLKHTTSTMYRTPGA
ncbi:GNAT family N-acetyltransferase [Demequina sp. NBRC 110053]|uniref:GNAT family N-acetyltransferase n=1 Tax=Demequina sp. NBRC 110053 TaxID=1570342 RepID=UPI001184865E|nr:GNAT family N-acetyltransferase [Demequina sp. NBRC 110053]